MCGIVGAIAERQVADILLAGLKRLEYRGYDSAGVAVINEVGDLSRVRVLGKVKALEENLVRTPVAGFVGIAHTRWATHGRPHESNAHPLISGDSIAVVHNGIIENHKELHDRLTELGYEFSSETDSENIAHLIHYYQAQGANLVDAVRQVTNDLTGAYALVVMDKREPDTLVAVRRGSPLVVGLGINENFLASDQLALLPVVQRFMFLDEGDVVYVTRRDVTVYDEHGNKTTRDVHETDMTCEMAEKGPYRHFMQKEIYEQTAAISATLDGRLGDTHIEIDSLAEAGNKVLGKTQTIQIIACGTSYHAGLVAKYWIESLVKIPCRVEIASEFRYRDVCVTPNTLFVAISQSGETADTMAALRKAKQLDFLASLAICNVPESSLVRESDYVLMTRAGTEIGVASTKAFTTQLVALLLLSGVLARYHAGSEKAELMIMEALRCLPHRVAEVLNLNDAIEELANQFADKRHALFLGRGSQYPIALEGALKLKEITYIHAEAYPAGELKHGPLALVDKDMPVIAVAPNDALLEKLKANLEEVQARGGALFVFADHEASIKSDEDVTTLTMPACDSLIAPIVYTIPLQLLAYHVGVLIGTDVDQPRNLAKSVTVE